MNDGDKGDDTFSFSTSTGSALMSSSPADFFWSRGGEAPHRFKVELGGIIQTIMQSSHFFNRIYTNDDVIVTNARHVLLLDMIFTLSCSFPDA